MADDSTTAAPDERASAEGKQQLPTRCTTPLECFRLFIAHVGAAITGALFYSRAIFMRNVAMVFRTSTVLRASIGSRAVLASQGVRTLLRAYGAAIVRLILAFVIGVQSRGSNHTLLTLIA